MTRDIITASQVTIHPNEDYERFYVHVGEQYMGAIYCGSWNYTGKGGYVACMFEHGVEIQVSGGLPDAIHALLGAYNSL